MPSVFRLLHAKGMAVTTHCVKCWREFFAHLRDGSKKFEYRVNDRNYQAGDTIVLKESDKRTGLESGDRLTFRIAYVLLVPHPDGIQRAILSLESI